jgi:isoleucyl-tRNA synthetase
MPVAQWHYPFENKEKFEEQFPADYICEGVDQTRGWFYSLHAISTLLFGEVSFKNVISLGLILDGEGQKMSKSKGNIIAPWDVLSAHGADAFRWALYGDPPEMSGASSTCGRGIRSFTLTLWNVYSFFVTYANLDKPTVTTMPIATSDLDRWLLSELNVLVRDVTKAYETYDVPNATRPIEAFVEKMSTWYLRRSRRRFWKSESDSDKQAAYSTLYTALVTARLLASTPPYRRVASNLVLRGWKAAPTGAPAQWPEVFEMIDDLNRDMALVMDFVSSVILRGRRQIEECASRIRSCLSVGND